MLIFLAALVGVPAGPVHEIEVVGHFDKSHSGLNEASRKQAALAELVSVEIAQFRRFVGKIKVTHEIRARQAKGLALGIAIAGN